MASTHSMLNFGPIRQIGYLTRDIEHAMHAWTQHAGLGPFTWYRNVSLNALYAGEPTVIEMEVAIAFRGDLQIELIQQTNAAPSPYLQHLRREQMGMHHMAYATRDLDASLNLVREAGGEVVCTIEGAIGRFAYFRNPAMPENYFEFLEAPAPLEAYWQKCMHEAANWDGREPVRILDLKGV